MRRLVPIFLLLFILTFVIEGCSNADREKDNKTDTAAAYHEMLENESQTAVAQSSTQAILADKTGSNNDVVNSQEEKDDRDGMIIEFRSDVASIMIIVIVILFIIIILCCFVYYQKLIVKLRIQNADLEKANKEYQRRSYMKNLFVQNMSHEVRTPLNSITGFVQILSCPDIEISKEEKEEYSTHIMNNIHMLSMLVDDILNISDIENNNYKISLRNTDIDAICQSTISITQYRVPSGVEFRYINHLPAGYCCVTDAHRVQQVLINYITNACKYTQKGSIELEVNINTEPKYIKFTVTDTGKGIPADQAHNIFGRFAKLDDFVEGTGLGLNICATLARRLHGHVWLDTTYTTGARFCFTIPLDLKEDI